LAHARHPAQQVVHGEATLTIQPDLLKGWKDELVREIRIRRKIYPRWIKTNRLKASDAEKRLTALETLWSFLDTLDRNGDLHIIIDGER